MKISMKNINLRLWEVFHTYRNVRPKHAGRNMNPKNWQSRKMKKYVLSPLICGRTSN